MKMKHEVLAPAGDWECLNSAILYGADAVYLGGEIFGMRSSAAKFNDDLLEKAVKLAHKNNVKIYLTCNTVPTNVEADKLTSFMGNVQDIGVDALIIADFGTMMEAKKFAPKIPIHISTQAGIMNYKTANALYELGAQRVVLARELPLNDIEIISKKTPSDLEIECFVHGATCMSFSGRCLISQYMLGRDANRGECAQPCRWGYHIVEEKRPNQYFPIFEDEKGSYILNSKDLCLIEHLDKLSNAGVTSFKIEGRAKSSYYVSAVTNAYRMATDILEKEDDYVLPEWIKDELLKVSHRHYHEGFLFGKPAQGQYYKNGGYIRNYDIVAVVDNCDGEFLYCTQKNKFNVGDVVEILQPNQKPFIFKVNQILNNIKEPILSAPHSQMKLYIPFENEVKKGSIVRKKID